MTDAPPASWDHLGPPAAPQKRPAKGAISSSSSSVMSDQEAVRRERPSRPRSDPRSPRASTSPRPGSPRPALYFGFDVSRSLDCNIFWQRFFDREFCGERTTLPFSNSCSSTGGVTTGQHNTTLPTATAPGGSWTTVGAGTTWQFPRAPHVTCWHSREDLEQSDSNVPEAFVGQEVCLSVTGAVQGESIFALAVDEESVPPAIRELRSNSARGTPSAGTPRGAPMIISGGPGLLAPELAAALAGEQERIGAALLVSSSAGRRGGNDEGKVVSSSGASSSGSGAMEGVESTGGLNLVGDGAPGSSAPDSAPGSQQGWAYHITLGWLPPLRAKHAGPAVAAALAGALSFAGGRLKFTKFPQRVLVKGVFTRYGGQ